MRNYPESVFVFIFIVIGMNSEVGVIITLSNFSCSVCMNYSPSEIHIDIKIQSAISRKLIPILLFLTITIMKKFSRKIPKTIICRIMNLSWLNSPMAGSFKIIFRHNWYSIDWTQIPVCKLFWVFTTGGKPEQSDCV